MILVGDQTPMAQRSNPDGRMHYVAVIVFESLPPATLKQAAEGLNLGHNRGG